MKKALFLGTLLGLLLAPAAALPAADDAAALKPMRRGALLALDIFPDAWKAWQGMQRREERDTLKDRLGAMRAVLANLPELEKKVADLLASLAERPSSQDVEAGLRDLRTELLKQLADLQERIGKVERTVEKQEGRLVRVEALSSLKRPAKLLLTTGRTLDVILDGIPDDKGVKAQIGGEDKEFPAEVVLVISVATGSYRRSEPTKPGFIFVPSKGDPAAPPKVARELPITIEDDSPTKWDGEAIVLLAAMTRGEREDLYSYARRRNRDLENAAIINQLEWVRAKLASERAADMRILMNETGCTEAQAFRIILHLEARAVMEKWAAAAER